jgi:hypothetical protein
MRRALGIGGGIIGAIVGAAGGFIASLLTGPEIVSKPIGMLIGAIIGAGLGAGYASAVVSAGGCTCPAGAQAFCISFFVFVIPGTSCLFHFRPLFFLRHRRHAAPLCRQHAHPDLVHIGWHHEFPYWHQ